MRKAKAVPSANDNKGPLFWDWALKELEMRNISLFLLEGTAIAVTLYIMILTAFIVL